ncbi:MAG: hypothetical protein HQK89_11880 [Nitrospirae bacterium]|nr:hypothetical protein [Nitrospirota bacterium]
MESISTITKESGIEAMEIKVAATTLASLSVELQDLTMRFKFNEQCKGPIKDGNGEFTAGGTLSLTR